MVNKSELVYKGVVVDVYKEEANLPNGNRVTLDLVRHPGASAVVPIMNDGRFVLLRQYRHAAGGYLFEIPAGKFDKKGEDPLACAKRELAEETGYTAKKWTRLITIRTTPGFSDEQIHIFLAEDLLEGRLSHEHDEVIEVLHFSRAEIERMLSGGEITDAKTLVGIYAALRSR